MPITQRATDQPENAAPEAATFEAKVTRSSPEEDRQVVQAVLAGDTEQFAKIVRRYEVALLRVAISRLGRREWAEEVVQESLLAAFRSIRSYNEKYNFRTWLWTILLNQCRRRYQRAKSKPEPVPIESAGESPERLVSSQPTPVEQAIQAEQSRHLDTLLDQLPSQQADALRLRFFANLKYDEIAQTMGCSLSSAKNRVRTGLSKLSTKLQSKNLQPANTETNK